MHLEFDIRANRLRESEVREDPLRLLLNADHSVFLQVRHFLASAGLVVRPIPFPSEEESRWTHCLGLDRLPPGLDGFLDLLRSILVLKNIPTEIDDALALDFYKIPLDGVDSEKWPDTEVGELVSRMKYWKTDVVAQAHARSTLADRLAGVITTHPLYSEAVLVSTPGHSRMEVSQSELLAGEVASRLDSRLVKARARSLIRSEAKARAERVDFRDEFDLDRDSVAHASVVIIDDVFGRGTTMRGVATAARRSGARSVHGLVAARTIR